jgi:hypothetical protein
MVKERALIGVLIVRCATTTGDGSLPANIGLP